MPRTHKSLQRLFLDRPLASGDVIGLDKEQSNYLGNVLRKKAGDEVIVFNGRDGAFLGAIAQAGKKQVDLSIGEKTVEQTAPSNLWYGFAPLKSGRLDYMIQKATEMGAGILQPVMTQFTQQRHIRTDKMRANAIEAAEQCEVLCVPEVRNEISLSDLIEEWPSLHSGRVLIFADEEATAASPIEPLRELQGKPVGLLVGPEGGFSQDERELLLAKEFVRPISLGPRILRADTAAVAALAVIQSTIGDWR